MIEEPVFMRILGIETSCDETAIAVMEASGPKMRPRIKILSNAVLSQVSLHRKFGGVVPHLAKREHEKNLVAVLFMALKEAGFLRAGKNNFTDLQLGVIHGIFEREPELLEKFLKAIPKVLPPKIDAIAVTAGPGLEPALWAGVNFARALSYIWKKPLIPVNHLEGHIYTVLLGGKPLMKRRFHALLMKLPALILIVSGGHTELVLMRKFGKYEIIGETRDDAAGEAFDKVAKMLKLGYPGGPIISKLAERVKQDRKINVKLPRPMINSNDFDFSFSGLKTAVLYLLKDLEKKYAIAELRTPVSYEFQNAVCDVLVAKTIRAARKYKTKSVIIGGGVAANKLLRERLAKIIKQEAPKTALYLPSTRFTGDNALMIALAAYFGLKKQVPWQNIRAQANLRLSE
ncbi:MAG: tRNA (adenosine(37)-N6)-threonylcarbamoyltransferase complex transferase subunit TsaD [Candidatus Sungiibacteriota bacterium]